jgi:hypothetical protein
MYNYNRFLKLVTRPFPRSGTNRNSPLKIHAPNMSNTFNYLPRSPSVSTWTSSTKNIQLPVWTSFEPADRVLSPETLYSTIPGRTFRSLRIISRIGVQSVHGAAYKCMYNSRPVILKVIDLTDPEELSGFFNELRIGKINGIEKLGTKTLAYGVSNNIGYHVMTDVTYNQSNLTSVSLNEYMTRLNACPSTNHSLYKKLFKTLFDFYKLTKGYHGDLHGGNVYVLYKPHDINDVKSIKIIDYGAHVKFKNSNALEKCTTIIDIFKLINIDFMNNLSKAKHLNTIQPLRRYARVNTSGGIPTIFPHTIREAYRPNTQLIGKGVLFRNQSTTRKKFKKMSSVIRK